MKRGVTVLELLAVVAIVAVLGAIGVSAAGGAVKAAKRTGDIAALRQCGQARLMYLSDTDRRTFGESIDPLLDGRYVPAALLASKLDPTPGGYSNVMRRHRRDSLKRPGPPVRAEKISFVGRGESDLARPRDEDAKSERIGWLLAFRHGKEAKEEDLISTLLSGTYHRLCNDGSVVTRTVSLQRKTEDGGQLLGLRMSTLFEDGEPRGETTEWRRRS